MTLEAKAMEEQLKLDSMLNKLVDTYKANKISGYDDYRCMGGILISMKPHQKAFVESLLILAIKRIAELTAHGIN